ncbi:MAG: DUF3019 domain-containing protein [Cellvibrio sp.]|uniref:DUF3019 domain-containing protein n=1 Tax=Cellvibrio sp. TaxID=1965322 RepID=UPI0031AF11FD
MSTCLSVFVFSVHAQTLAEAPIAQLQSKPNRCVALHQGQVCYQDIVLYWHADRSGEYCIYQKQAQEPLHCWQAQASGEYRYAFASDSPVQLQLVSMNNKTPVAEMQIDVAWVYKANTRRKTHWRLF